jgi:hypothetical protein
MWPFSKKESRSLDLPPLNAPKPNFKGEIEIIPDELLEIPNELPQLQEKTMMTFPEKEIEQPMVHVERPKKTIETKDVFIKTETHKSIISGINEVVFDFDRINNEIERITDIKTSRYEKIDGLQSTLEEVGKKLMTIDQSLFGG